MTIYEQELDNWYLELATRYLHDSSPCPKCGTDMHFVNATDFDPAIVVCSNCGYTSGEWE